MDVDCQQEDWRGGHSLQVRSGRTDPRGHESFIHVFAGRELYHCTGLDGRELRSEYQLGKHAGFSEHQREIGARTNNHKGHEGSQRKSSVSLWTFVSGACPEQSRRVVNEFSKKITIKRASSVKPVSGRRRVHPTATRAEGAGQPAPSPHLLRLPP